MKKYPRTENYDPAWVAKNWMGPNPLWLPEMFNFHSKDWWRHLWEKTCIVEITACYNIDNPKEIWRPWAEWSFENFAKEWGGDGEFDMKFLKADTNNDVALIVMSAVKK